MIHFLWPITINYDHFNACMISGEEQGSHTPIYVHCPPPPDLHTSQHYNWYSNCIVSLQFLYSVPVLAKLLGVGRYC